jgi:prepilin-type N-terminal cleavage/methylation domain-containing protein
MNPINRRRCTAFTLVEVIAVTAIMAVLATSSFALVRTAHDAWRRHRDDAGRRREAIAVLQHMVRRLRQATEVTSISGSADMSGYITATMADGTTAAWDHDGAASRVLYGSPTATNLLGEGITAMLLAGFTANGVTATTDPAKIRVVYCRLGYTIAKPTGNTTEYVSCMAWLRSW